MLVVLVEFFAIALFHEIKIPTVDMKVQVYSKISIKNFKKMKSPSFIKNGRFHTPKCRATFAFATCKSL
jgi:hypothetical protein